MENLAQQLKEAKTTVTITPDPMTLEKVGDSFRGTYLGLRNFEKTNPDTGEVKTMQVAHFYDGEKVVFNMGAQLTSAIQVLPPGVSVEVKLKELKSNGRGGKLKLYSITPLDIPRIDLREMFGGLLEISAPAPEHLALPGPKPPKRDLRSIWSGFCTENRVTESFIQKALGTPLVSEWLNEYPSRQLEDAMALVLDAMKPEPEPHF